MRALNEVLAVTLILIASTGLVQCGQQKGKAANVSVFPIPDEPVVITADVTISGKDVKGPWFRFAVKLKNGSDQKFEIVALQAEISITDQTGNSVTKDFASAPGGLNIETDTLTCKYDSYGTFDVNEEEYLQVEGTGSCPTIIPSFVIDGLAKPTGNSYRYRVKLKPVGYFVDSNGLPDGRFEKEKTFFTQ